MHWVSCTFKTSSVKVSIFLQCRKMQLIPIKKFNNKTCLIQFHWFFRLKCWFKGQMIYIIHLSLLIKFLECNYVIQFLVQWCVKPRFLNLPTPHLIWFQEMGGGQIEWRYFWHCTTHRVYIRLKCLFCYIKAGSRDLVLICGRFKPQTHAKKFLVIKFSNRFWVRLEKYSFVSLPVINIETILLIWNFKTLG